MTLTQALTLVPVLLSFAMVFYVLARKFGFPVLAGTLLALLLHEWIIRWLTYLIKAPPMVVTAASLWKDGALAGIAIVWLQNRLRDRRGRPRSKRIQVLDGLLGLIITLGLVSAFMSPNRLAGVMAFRDYYEPVLVFVLVAAFYPTKQQLTRFVHAWLVILALMAILGIVQTTLWSRQDFERWWFGPAGGGYGIPELELRGVLRFRGPSTVTGPNELGMHMVLGLLLASQLMLTAERRRQWLYFALGLLYGIALVLTFSRSALLASLIGIAVLFWLRIRDRAPVFGRWSLQNAAIVGVMFIVVLRSGLFGHVTATAAEPQAQYHVQDTSSALEVLLDHPAGVGMGMVGPRTGAFFPEQPAFHVEGSIFQIAFEMGIWGLALWAMFAVVTGVWAVRGWRRAEDPLDRALVGTAVGGGLGLSFVLLFLPLMQSMPLMSWMWFLLGYAVHLGHSDAGHHRNPEA